MLFHKTLIVVELSCCLVLVGCSISEMNLAKYSYEFFENKEILEKEYQLSSNESYWYHEIADGSKNVFKHNYIAAENPRIIDDEYSETLFFQVDPQLDTFRFENDGLEQANCYFTVNCLACPPGPYKVRRGTIIGEKTGPNEYLVNANISLPGPARAARRGGISKLFEKVKFQKVFKRTQWVNPEPPKRRWYEEIGAIFGL